MFSINTEIMHPFQSDSFKIKFLYHSIIFWHNVTANPETLCGQNNVQQDENKYI